MKKRTWLSYFLLGIFCFALLNFQPRFLLRFQGPFFGFEELFAASFIDPKTLEISDLQKENAHLKKQIEAATAFLLSSDHIEKIYKKCSAYEVANKEAFSSFYARRLEEMVLFLNQAKWQIPCNVIYRDPANWSSAIWVDVGSKDNALYKREIIAINSPVIFGNQLVGVVEKVEKGKSLVRLITDSRVNPAVRCVRGGEQKAYIHNACKQLKDLLQIHGDTLYSGVIDQLDTLISSFNNEDQSYYLAKGYMMGSSTPIWRSRSLTLQGVGFNYDFGDEEGPPKSIHDPSQIPLFQKGDLLLTTGLDGVFPSGLVVGYVKEVFPLKEGAVSCDLEAKIPLPEFSDLRKVTILPPM